MTNEWLEQNVPNYIESGPHGEWPANSPDLNPIEQVWRYMKEKLERSKPRSIPALKRKIQQVWANVDEESVQKQADGMQKRLKVDHQVWWRVHGELSGWFLLVVTRVAPNSIGTSDVLLLCKNKIAFKTNLTPLTYIQYIQYIQY